MAFALLIICTLLIIVKSNYTCPSFQPCIINCTFNYYHGIMDASDASSLTLHCGPGLCDCSTSINSVYLPIGSNYISTINCAISNCNELELYYEGDNNLTSTTNWICDAHSCQKAMLYALNADTVNIKCISDGACYQGVYHMQNANDIDIICNGNSCSETKFYAQNANNINIACNQSCHDSSFYTENAIYVDIMCTQYGCGETVFNAQNAGTINMEGSGGNMILHAENADTVNLKVNADTYNLTLFAQNAKTVNIICFNDGTFHIENVENVNIICFNCHSATFHMENASNIDIVCNGTYSCHQGIYYMENANYIDIACNGDGSCDNTQFNLPDSDKYHINCTKGACNNIKLYSMNGFDLTTSSQFVFPDSIRCLDGWNMNISCNMDDISYQSTKLQLFNPDGESFSCIGDVCGCTNIKQILQSILQTCDCGDDQFRCNDLSCIDFKWVCNDNDDCFDGSDETAAACGSVGGYHCSFNSGNLAISKLTDSDGLNMTVDEAQQIIDAAESVKDIGIDIQDNVVLIALYCVNIITSLFIIIGLYLYQNKVGFTKEFNVNLVVGLIIWLQMLVTTSINMFQEPMVNCTLLIGSFHSTQTISWFDVVQSFITSVLYYIWFKNVCTAKCCWCRYFVVVCCILLLPLYLLIGAGYRYNSSTSMYFNYQVYVNMFWCLIIIQDIINSDKPSWLKNDKCRRCLYCFMIIASLIPIKWFLNRIFIDEGAVFEVANMCLLFGLLVMVNPVMLITSILLLFSKARYTILLYQLILGIITMGGLIHNEACTLILNLQYVSHALLVPIYIILIFIAIKELRKWSSQLISMYIVSFNVTTDVIVIYYFVNNGDYMFAVLQISFIVTGQILGSFSKNLFNDIQHKLTKNDKLMSSLGFGRAWFLVKSWSDINGKYKDILYRKLAAKHQIWELMFEEIPSLILQIYASLIIDSFSLQIVSSIIIEFLSITRNVWMYLIEVGYKEEDEVKNEEKHNVQITDIELTTKNDDDIEIIDECKHGEEQEIKSKNTNNKSKAHKSLTKIIPHSTIHLLSSITSNTKSTQSQMADNNKPSESVQQYNAPNVTKSHQSAPNDEGEDDEKTENQQETEEIDTNNSDEKEQEKVSDETLMNEVKIWLDTEVGLIEYFDIFIESGFNSMEMVKEINNITYLDYIGIHNKAHKIKIFNHITKINLNKSVNSKHEQSDNIENELKNKIPSYLPKLFENRSFHFAFFGFMISDLYIRSIPLIIFISSIPCKEEEVICMERTISFCLLMISLLIFEFIINIKMRIKDYKSICFVIQIFPISILSSFYTLLCTLDLLKKDAFFGQSVKFKWFLYEHKIRIILSIIINIINLSLFTINESKRNIMISILLLLYAIFFIVNYVSIKYIKKYQEISNSLSIINQNKSK